MYYHLRVKPVYFVLSLVGVTTLSSPSTITLHGTFDPKPELTNGVSEGTVAKKRPLNMLEISDDDYYDMLVKFKRRKQDYEVSKEI